MSRVTTPTDNPIIESLNGCIKEEMKIDFNLRDAENISSFIENYVYYFNHERLPYKLNCHPLFSIGLIRDLDN